MNPLISIITPAYNCEKFVAEAIESVLQQSFHNWEMIIVNDASTDHTPSILQMYTKRDKRIRVITNSKNLGVAKSRNIAIEAALGDYIAFLDSDDIWFKEKLEKQLAFILENNLVISYSAYNTINEHGMYINSRIPPKEISYKDLLKSNHIGNLTAIYDCRYFGKVYLEQAGHEDYILWLNLLKRVGKTKGIVEPLASYRVLSNSISSDKFTAIKWQWRIYRKFQKLSRIESFYYLLWYIYNGFKKRI